MALYRVTLPSQVAELAKLIFKLLLASLFFGG